MKIKFGVLLLLITVYANGQEWAPIGATWYYDHNDGLASYLTFIHSVADTNIHDKDCRILETFRIDKATDNGLAYYWDTILTSRDFLYYNNDTIYHYDKFALDFYPLYEFNVTQNDTILVREENAGECNQPDYYCSRFEYVVDSLSSIKISDKDLRLIYNSPTAISDWVFNVSWNYENRPIIEMIGSTKFLFGVYRNSILEGDIYCLRCYQDKNLSYVSKDWSNECDYLPPINNSGIVKFTISKNLISPNPFNDYILIDLQGDNQINYRLYNMSGQIVGRGMDNKIDTSQLPIGSYYLQLIKNDSDFEVIKLIKHLP
jgi:hypothetical protein